ncbi:hypothetical protein BDN70DRAFT_882501 [Pholiota conissans]|uniref:Uncharacterized protein n=1 Tax=Pholiota conissans TaxID=109636 RepID=A0A9P5YVF3_9AGAR|nr:hypothetical protein BDN70DRAFT_882501 [Pholiota conissans]
MDTPQLASMNELIEALKGHDHAADIFCMNSMNKLKNQASFQLSTCTEDADGNVTISLGAFEYSTTDPIDNPLFTSISSINTKFSIDM